MQVSKDPGAGPSLNESGEMVMLFPPTTREIEVLKLHGTKILRINMCPRPTGGAGQRTRVNARGKNWCQLGTTDWREKVRDADRITDNLDSSRVKDSHCASYYGLSVHRDAIERCLPVALINERIINICSGSMLSSYYRLQ